MVVPSEHAGPVRQISATAPARSFDSKIMRGELVRLRRSRALFDHSMEQRTHELPSAAELYEMIAEAAYYRAQKRGFTPGLEADDWVQAEQEVMERVRKVRSNGSGA